MAGIMEGFNSGFSAGSNIRKGWERRRYEELKARQAASMEEHRQAASRRADEQLALNKRTADNALTKQLHDIVTNPQWTPKQKGLLLDDVARQLGQDPGNPRFKGFKDAITSMTADQGAAVTRMLIDQYKNADPGTVTKIITEGMNGGISMTDLVGMVKASEERAIAQRQKDLRTAIYNRDRQGSAPAAAQPEAAAPIDLGESAAPDAGGGMPALAGSGGFDPAMEPADDEGGADQFADPEMAFDPTDEAAGLQAPDGVTVGSPSVATPQLQGQLGQIGGQLDGGGSSARTPGGTPPTLSQSGPGASYPKGSLGEMIGVPAKTPAMVPGAAAPAPAQRPPSMGAAAEEGTAEWWADTAGRELEAGNIEGAKSAREQAEAVGKLPNARETAEGARFFADTLTGTMGDLANARYQIAANPGSVGAGSDAVILQQYLDAQRSGGNIADTLVSLVGKAVIKQETYNVAAALESAKAKLGTLNYGQVRKLFTAGQLTEGEWKIFQNLTTSFSLTQDSKTLIRNIQYAEKLTEKYRAAGLKSYKDQFGKELDWEATEPEIAQPDKRTAPLYTVPTEGEMAREQSVKEARADELRAIRERGRAAALKRRPEASRFRLKDRPGFGPR